MLNRCGEATVAALPRISVSCTLKSLMETVGSFCPPDHRQLLISLIVHVVLLDFDFSGFGVNQDLATLVAVNASVLLFSA